MPPLLKSCVCTQKQMESPEFLRWANRLPPVRPEVRRDKPHLDRKLWEWCYIAQALEERGMLCPGKRGLAFAVGTEPLPALFAGMGCQIVATDQARKQAERQGWSQTRQHSESLDSLYYLELCPADAFRQRVSFRVADMNRIPTDLRDFDFVWSACSFEHLGNLARGLRFLLAMLDCLKPGGVAVHTTEYNVSSDTETIRSGGFVIYRRCDLEHIARQLRSLGHAVDMEFESGDDPADLAIDTIPYSFNPHLKLALGGYTVTSFGLTIHKSPDRTPATWGHLYQTYWRIQSFLASLKRLIPVNRSPLWRPRTQES